MKRGRQTKNTDKEIEDICALTLYFPATAKEKSGVKILGRAGTGPASRHIDLLHRRSGRTSTLPFSHTPSIRQSPHDLQFR